MSDLATELKALDASNDDHWTQAGLPNVGFVNGKVEEDVTRAVITATAPDFNRENAETYWSEGNTEPTEPSPEAPPVEPPSPETDCDHDGGDPHSEACELYQEKLELVRVANLAVAKETQRRDAAQAVADAVLVVRENTRPRTSNQDGIADYIAKQNARSAKRNEENRQAVALMQASGLKPAPPQPANEVTPRVPNTPAFDK